MVRDREILETVAMITEQNLDVRTITMGISLMDCVNDNIDVLCNNIYDKITKSARDIVKVGNEIQEQYGIPIVNKRVSVTGQI